MDDMIKKALDEALDKVGVDKSGKAEKALKKVTKEAEKYISDEKKRKELISMLKKAEKMGIKIPFSEKMSIEDLEKLVKSIKKK